MEKVKILTEDEINENLSEMPGWIYKDNKINKEFAFSDFMDGLRFINKLAKYCEEVDHHPNVHLYFRKVVFELQRVDAGGKITDKDFMVAKQIEKLYKNGQKID